MANSTFQINTAWTQQANHLMPYSFAIGLQMGTDQQGKELFYLPFSKQNIGNVFLPALHGGLINGFLQSCMTLSLHQQIQLPALPQPIDLSIDYLRSGLPQDCYARCELIRQGRRIGNISATVWQEDEQKPIATGRAHFSLAS